MLNNPFTSNIFTSVWQKHFNNGQRGVEFNFIKNIQFYKPGALPLYINAGRNHTKGISYVLNDSTHNDFRKKAFLIYDVPEFFNVNTSITNKRLKFHKIKQYKGFLIDLNSHKNFDEYMLSTFKKSSRYKLNKYKKRLELCFNIKYKMLYGEETSKEEYDFVFEKFRELLEKRFLDKKVNNNNLDPKEWNFYYNVVYPMILEKKASLFVIYDGDIPIGVTLNYFSENTLFDAITVFDIDYSKFHLGSVTIMKLIEWCLEHDIQTFDFSKGYFDYKTRWMNREYNFEYHVYYDSGSLVSKGIAFFISSYFKLKQYLRSKNINEKFHKIVFKLRGKKPIIDTNSNYEFKEIPEGHKKENLVEIDFNTKLNSNIKLIVFEFLYLNTECIGDIKIYKAIDKDKAFILYGKEKKVEIQLK